MVVTRCVAEKFTMVGSGLTKMIFRLLPVSYTHLDVYKRQAQCGYCANAEDAEGLAQAVRDFIRNPEKKQLGKNARTYYERHFTREMFMDRLEKELSDYAGQQEEMKI